MVKHTFKVFKTLVLLLLLLELVIMNQALAAPQIPLRDFFKNPEKAAFQISPDGNYLSFMQPYQNRMNVFVQKRGSYRVVMVTNETERDISGYFWKSNHQIIYSKDFKGDENYHVVAVDR